MRVHTSASALVTTLLLSATPVGANQPPNAPLIYEPPYDGIELNAADLHMVSGFSDPDPGDTHHASDYEIWNNALTERVWAALNVTGLARVHLHFGDGVFQGSHAGRTTLLFETAYQLKVRHQDSQLAWGPYAVRSFQTAPASAIFPMVMQDVLASPSPTWTSSGSPVILAAGATPPSLRIESHDDADLLLEIAGLNGSQNQVTNPPPLSGDEAVRVVIHAGGGAGGLVVGESNLAFTDNRSSVRTIYLPPISLAAGQSMVLWVSVNGSTYHGSPGQTEPSFSSLARGSPVPWTVFDSNYKVEVVATGFRLPVHLAFVGNPGPNPSDPFYYVTELHHGVKVVTRDGTVRQYAQNLLNFTPSGSFSGPGEIGVSGIAIDPFNGDLFVGIMYSISGNTGGPWTPRIIRLRSNDGGLSAATISTIIDDAPNQYSYSHIVGMMTIGPDNRLYVQIGEGNIADRAQNLDSIGGKILRINLDGTAPLDNPFYTTPTAKRSFVWAYGYRNPFGGGWRDVAGGQRLYIVENGPTTDRLSKAGHGHNNNWGTAGDSDGQMFSNAIYNWSPAHAPTALAFIQASSFNGSGFPAGKMGRMYVCESGPTAGVGPWAQGKRIVEFTLHSNPDIHFSQARLSGPTTLVEYTGSGSATALGLAAGPDGLYFTDLYKDFGGITQPGANVLRVRYKGVGSIGGTVKDATGAPIGGASVTTNPGGFSATTAANGTFSLFNVPTGTYSVTAQKGGYSTATLPTVQIVENQSFVADFTLQFGVTNGTISGTVKDASNNPLPGASVATGAGGYSATAGAGGSYLLEGIPPGTYAVQASFAGFITAGNPSVVVNAGQNSTVNFVLQPVAPFSGIVNKGFENGFFYDPNIDHQTGNGWKQFTIQPGGASKSGGNATIKRNGTWSQTFYESSYTSGIWQKATNASIGSLYTGKAWLRGRNIVFHVGVDPAGGTDPAAASIQWSSPLTGDDTFQQLTKQVAATGTAVTLFIKCRNPSASNVVSYIDDTDLSEQFVPPALPTISRSPASLVRTIHAGQNAPSESFEVANAGQGTLNYTIGDNVAWLSVTPTSGVITSGSDTIIVNYDAAFLNSGVYNGTITISDPAATNNPQTVAVTLTVDAAAPAQVGDFDGDGDVDMEDFGHLQSCFSGPGSAQTDAACQNTLLDGDVDVDSEDFAVFQACFSGPSIPADPDCAP